MLFSTPNLLVLLLCCCLLPIIHGLSPDGESLLALLCYWTRVPPSVTTSWNASHPTPCSWLGVVCHPATKSVIALNLSGYEISGQLGPEIASLTRLNSIDFSFNTLSGSIPPQLGNCTLLRHLDLSLNNLTGQIPQTLGNLNHLLFLGLFSNSLTGPLPDSLFRIPNMEVVYLNDNKLSGPLLSSVGNMTHLLYLYLDDNRLSGTIPLSVGNCSQLQSLFLSGNQFTGTLPRSLVNLENLVYLDLNTNSLEGSIPLGLGSCRKLEYLDLSINSFDGGIPPGLGNCTSLIVISAVNCGLIGPIPASFGQLSNLVTLHLSENRVSGKIPPELGNCRSLTDLQLDANILEGELPSELGMLTKLENLYLFENQLTGEIPVGIWRIKSLVQLQLYSNRFSGEIPLLITELKQLRNFSVFNNSFSGIIPQGLGINTSLERLDFTGNAFSGKIPPNLCYRKNLQRLTLGVNHFQGSIPSEIGSCATLTRLILHQNNLTGSLPEFVQNLSLSYVDLSNNSLGGKIPASLGNLTDVNSINLSLNKLTGVLPPELGNLVNLIALNISDNGFEGPLPSGLSNCKRLLRFDVSYNRLNGSIPSSLRNMVGLFSLVLSENSFTGGVPPFLFDFNTLSNLQLGGNLLGGEIPPSVGSIAAAQNLKTLNLSNNGLTGHLPAQVGKLIMLEHLDVSSNNLTGTLGALGGVSSLTFVNVSYNLFTGAVPAKLMKFLSSSPSSFMGNSGLCINCLQGDGSTCNNSSNFRSCDLQSSSRKGLSKVEIATIAITLSILVVLVFLGLGYIFIWRRRPEQEVEMSAEEGTSSLLRKVMEATENLNDKYIIGSGAHGTVYKASLGPDEVYAVKKLVFASVKEGSTSMVREIQTVGKVKHRNLVKLEDFWLRKDCGLILYNYMQNGSLHDVLHEISPPPALEWNVRYKIALGTAWGIAYLHFDIEPAIVHRDIKPMNILLDSDMEPHISDFGIAKLLDQSSAPTSTTTVQGTIGYIAPENAFTTTKSTESDVYSYGVVLLELITRKKALDPAFMEEEDIVGWVTSIWNNAKEIERIVDPGLLNEFRDSTGTMKQVSEVLLVALKCTGKEASERPSMREVVKRLEAVNFAFSYRNGPSGPLTRPLLYGPHISDFGIAKLLDQSSASTSTTTVQGTIGYIAPENAFTTTKSTESDVYSYGVVLLELITRKKALDPAFMEEEDIVGWVTSIWNNAKEIERIVDPGLLNEFRDSTGTMKQVSEVLLVALKCTGKEASERPSMREVVKRLEAVNFAFSYRNGPSGPLTRPLL